MNADAKWLSFRLRPGDDASCLNLYQPHNPRVLGAPASWMKLDSQNDGTVSAAVDANTLEYVLHRKVGDDLQVGSARLKIVRALQDTVFQSEFVVNDADFQKTFPEEQGFRVFLVDAPQGADAQIENCSRRLRVGCYVGLRPHRSLSSGREHLSIDISVTRSFRIAAWDGRIGRRVVTERA